MTRRPLRLNIFPSTWNTGFPFSSVTSMSSPRCQNRSLSTYRTAATPSSQLGQGACRMSVSAAPSYAPPRRSHARNLLSVRERLGARWTRRANGRPQLGRDPGTKRFRAQAHTPPLLTGAWISPPAPLPATRPRLPLSCPPPQTARAGAGPCPPRESACALGYRPPLRREARHARTRPPPPIPRRSVPEPKRFCPWHRDYRLTAGTPRIGP